ncbi:MAG: chromate resistance protein [Candidatus Obscuribacterales bacterium]
MSWLVFTYSLPSSARSSPRVTIWRRLNRLGAISPRGGVHILPDREDCMESFQWLTKEVQQQKGDCLFMRVEAFEGLTDQDLIALFQEKSDKEYSELEESLAELEKKRKSPEDSDEAARLHVEIEKLRKRHSEMSRTDFFDAPGGARIASRLARLERMLGSTAVQPEVARVSIDDFQNKVWVTRPRPHVDRLGCAWLIRRFIDEDAKIKYSNKPTKQEVAFDMKEGGTFGHVGNLCTFETMMLAFDLSEPGLQTVAEIVHEIDLRDSRYLHPETAGVDSILKGWLLKDFSDEQLESHGLALFDGLHADILRKEKAGGGEKSKE